MNVFLFISISTMDPKRLIYDLRLPICDIIHSNTDPSCPSWMTDAMQGQLIRSLHEYKSAVTAGTVDPKDTAFWAALTHHHRRGKDENQMEACEYYLGLNVRDRFVKRRFLSKLHIAFLGIVPHIDAERDLFLDRYGSRILPGYEKYKDVLHMRWENPNYSFPEDREAMMLDQDE